MSNPHWCTYCKGHNAHNCQFNEQLPRMHTYTTNHTSPPQSTWVGLTDEEVASIYMNHTDRPDRPIYEQWKFARAIEAKLKEKNGFDTPELAHQAYKENT